MLILMNSNSSSSIVLSGEGEADPVAPPASPGFTANVHLSVFSQQQQQQQQQQASTTRVPELLSQAEAAIIGTINGCIRHWHQPWLKTYLRNGADEFEQVFELMDGLMHYESQITASDKVLSRERIKAIGKAVARLVDYGNAILNLDVIVRVGHQQELDYEELDPAGATTVELFKAHVRARRLAQRLLNNYFNRKNHTPSTSTANHYHLQPPFLTDSSTNTLQIPSPRLERSDRGSMSSNTSLNIALLTDHQQRALTPQPSSTESSLSTRDTLINDMSQLEITQLSTAIKSDSFFSNQTTRLSLIPKVAAKIESLTSLPSNTDKLNTCFDLLGSLLDSLERLNPSNRAREVYLTSTALLRTLVHKVYIEEKENLVEFQNAHWTTYLISVIRLMSASDLSAYLKTFNNLVDLSVFLKDYLFVVKRIISASDKSYNQRGQLMELDRLSDNATESIFPDSWVEMKLVACGTILTSLTYLYQVLRQYFANNAQIWSSFIECLLQFALQEVTRPQRVMLKRRQKLLADDLRQTSAEYIWISWDTLSLEQKQHLIDDLIELLIRASMTLQSKQRSILLPIFYDMMRCDYTSQYKSDLSSLYGSSTSTLKSRRDIDFRQDNFDDTFSTSNNAQESLPYLSIPQFSNDGTVLTKFTHLIIGKLNNLMIEHDLGDQSFKEELCAAISGNLNPKYYNCSGLSEDMQFRSMAKHTSELIAEFMQICLDFRTANNLSYKHLYQICLFKFMLFFKDKVDRVELYLHNLYKLCYIHHNASRFVEAGFTLLELAKTLPWSNKSLDSHHRIANKFFHIDHPLMDYSGLKTFLYLTVIEYFDKGQAWEPALPLCRELIDFYQYKTFDYEKLAQVLMKMSLYSNNIVTTTNRGHPEYFRVSFYGAGFPNTLRDLTLVCRGKPFEKLGDFQNVMLDKYPEAKLINSLAPTGPECSLKDEPNAQYLLINACSPVIDLRAKFGTNLVAIDESILSYYRNNECDKFQFSRRISKPGSETSKQTKSFLSDDFSNIWREKTTLTTNTLPGILSFFPVYLTERKIISPIESAIEDLERTNDRLSSMVNQYKADKRQVLDIRLLSQLLLGVVDAAVNGGITRYEEAFFKIPDEAVNSSSSSSEMNHSNERNNEMLVPPRYQAPTNHDRDFGYEDHNSLVRLSSDTERSMNYQSTDPKNRLKHLIAQQLPLLEEALRVHRERVAEVMRPQHEHLESSYKKLKNHVMTKYSRYLPQDYRNSSMRSTKSSRSRFMSSVGKPSSTSSRLPTPEHSMNRRLLTLSNVNLMDLEVAQMTNSSATLQLVDHEYIKQPNTNLSFRKLPSEPNRSAG